MPKSQVRFITDEQGRPTHAVLPIALYQEVMDFLGRLNKLDPGLAQGKAGTAEQIFPLCYLKTRTGLAKGYAQGSVKSPRFVLLKGSTIAAADNESVPSHVVRARGRLKAQGALVLIKQDNCYNLLTDITLPSPSFAAMLVTGNACSGLKVWKDAKGTPLKSILGKQS